MYNQHQSPSLSPSSPQSPPATMYSMTQQQSIYSPYAMQAPGMSAPVATGPSRQYANHSNSSAFSSSANPDEDWTKISDLAERRRIQNRIAQRNYRKKLKRRLEDLERRAGTTDIPIPTKVGGRPTGANGKPLKSKKQQHTLSSLSAAAAAQQAAQAAQAQHHHQQQQQQQQQQAQRQSSVTHSQFTPPLHSEEDLMYTTHSSYEDLGHRQTHPSHSQSHHAHTHTHETNSHQRRSHSPLFTTSSTFSAYPPPEDSSSIPSTSASVSSSTSSSSTGQAPPRVEYRDYRGYEYSDWTLTAAVPVTLPSMNHFTDGAALKRESMDSMNSMDSMDSMNSMDGMDDSLSGGDPVAAAAAAAAVTVTMAPYMGTYGFLSTTGIDSVNPYDSNPHTPPLSSSYDHSTSCSDAGYEYPTTPLSMASPMRA